MPGPRAYLAGPDVFLPDPIEAGRRKKAICARYGLEGVFPLDGGPPPPGLGAWRTGFAISRRDEELMRAADLAIVNMTPFRGPSMDVGSAYEMGFMRALGRPVYAYSNTPVLFFERVRAFWGGALRPRPDGRFEGPDGMLVEDYDMVDNLMLDGGVAASGGRLFVGAVPAGALYTALAVFERCVRAAAEGMGLAVPPGPAA